MIEITKTERKNHEKKNISFLLISLTMTFASCGGKKAEESKDESPKTESVSTAESASATEIESTSESESATESEPAVEEIVEVAKLYDWNSLMDLPDPIPAEDNPENRMAHNIYVNPDLSQTSGQYTGFLIDFCTDCEANCMSQKAPKPMTWELF